MIRIFNPTDKDFSSNGNIAIKPLKLIETKKKSLNGWYIDVEVSVEYADHIKQDNLCVTKSKSKINLQAFRIDGIKVKGRTIVFKAHHVMFDADRLFLKDVRPVNMSAISALNYINDATDNPSPFTLTSNVVGANTAYFIRKTLIQAWSVIEERWAGVFDADNFNVTFKEDVAVDRQVSLTYGSQLESIEVVENWNQVVTMLYPTGRDGIMLPEKVLVSNIQYPQPYSKTVSFDTKLDDEEQTENNIIEELRANALAYLRENEVPKVMYTVKSDVNQNLAIGDLVVVKHPQLEINTTVQEYVYNVMTNRVATLVFGNYNRDVKKQFDSMKESINDAVEKASTSIKLSKEQTDLINNLNKNGYVYIDDNEILILDKLPREDAINVWRLGLGGLAFSPNGYEGPYSYALTQDGRFNASFIASGEITTNMLASDVGSSLDISSNNAINMEIANREAGDEFVKSSLEQTISDFNIQFQKEIADQNGKVNLLTSYFNFSDEGLEIGKSDSDFSILQTNDGISLNYKGTPISSWKIVNGVPQMDVTALIVLERIVMGNHIIMKHKNANEAKSGTIWQHTRKIG
ncbi:phage tail spike protein [Erysipelothrix aquatica]|uniref:phage tail spike protein n=1 Tax=Erysipelothrix aquatica TaxID=2683714 RepID=UPI00135BD184|nr:phage tail spike protein [Erysipelothrix aquatica]